MSKTSEAEPLPFNLDLEQSLIGAVMVNNEAYAKVSSIVTAQAFHEPVHAHIWGVIEQMIGAGKLATPITLKSYLGDFDLGKGVTPMAYLARLSAEATTVLNAPDYAADLRDLHVRRRMIGIANAAKAIANELPPDLKVTDVIMDLSRDLDALIPQAGGEYGTLTAFGKIDVSDVAEAHQSQSGVSGISTGYSRLDDLMGGMVKGNVIILAGRPAMGKCQPLDAKILMRNGSWKRMGAIQIGDPIASHDGRASHVSAIYPQGMKEVFEVTFSDGRIAKATAEHLWRVMYRDWEAPRVISTDKLRAMLSRKRYQGRLSVDVVSGDFGKDPQMPIDPWLIGLILGNSRISGGIRLTTRDEENLRRAERFLPMGMRLARKENGIHSIRQRDSWRAGQRGVTANTIANYLAYCGLGSEGCHTMFVPPDWLCASRANRKALLQGLMDANGYVEKTGSVRFITTSRQLAIDVRTLVRSFGGLCNIVEKVPSYTYKGEKKDGRPAFICCIRHPDSSVLFCNENKKIAAERSKNTSVRLNVVSVKSCGMAQTQCIRVSHPDSLYVTDEFVVTHNTALATGIGVNVARREQAKRRAGESIEPVAFFSLEMPSHQVKKRVLSEMAGVMMRKLMRGDAENHEMQAFLEAERETKDLPFYIDQTGSITLAQLKQKARRFKKLHGMSLLIVDYLQLMHGSNSRKNDNRVQEITEITTGLKALAKELDVPLLALSQLSRKVEERPDKRPTLIDLRESGSIEQDADVVMFVYREEYYLRQNEPRQDGEAHEAWKKQIDRWSGIAEVITGKNRHEATGAVELGWEGWLTRFTPEPPHRQIEPEESRRAERRVKLTEDGVALKEIILEVATLYGRRPTGAEVEHSKGKLHKQASMVDREEVRRLFRERVVPDLPPAAQNQRIQRAADNLRIAKQTGVYNDPDNKPYIYLISMIPDE